MSMNFSFDFVRNTFAGRPTPKPEPQTPFRILVLGDFSGRANRSQLDPIDARGPVQVDIDTLEPWMGRWKTRLALHAGTDDAFAIGFQQLDHFHPDEIFRRVEVFQGLRDLRARLVNPGTSAQAAAEVRRWASGKCASTLEAKPAEAPATPRSEFEALLGGTAGAVPSGAASRVDAMIRDLIRPHIVPSAAPDQPELIATVDRTIAELMRALLHDPAFQKLESNWRSLHTLITGLETGEELQVWAFDVCRAELEHDVFHEGARGLHALLAEEPCNTPGGQPWSVICLLERFAAGAGDAHLFGALAVCAHASGAVLLAGGADELAGTDSIARNSNPDRWTQRPDPEGAEAWHLVRSLAEAGSVGLSLPRVLARLPYGPRTEPVEAFAFEECPPGWSHESLLWSNSAILCALLLGRAFSSRGWSLDPNAGGDVDGLPVFVPETGSDRAAVPCAEAWLSDAGSNRLLTLGLIPVMSVQHRDAVHVPRLCAIHGGPLCPAWA